MDFEIALNKISGRENEDVRRIIESDIRVDLFELFKFIVFKCLRQDYDIHRVENSLSILLDKLDFLAADYYIENIFWTSDLPIELLKKAILIKSEKSVSYDEKLDEALSIMYKTDTEFVLSILRKRMESHPYSKIASDELIYHINQTDKTPFLSLIEEMISSEKHYWFIVDLLEDLFESNIKWLEWCVKWKHYDKFNDVILTSMIRMLSHLLKHKGETLRKKLKEVISEYEQEMNLDYMKEVKEISTNDNYRTEILQDLAFVRKLLRPNKKIDKDNVVKNIIKYPYIKTFYGESFLIDSIQKEPHLFCYYFDYYKSEENSLKSYFQYWENVFKQINKNQISIPKHKKESNEDASVKSCLAEFELLSKFIESNFSIELEPEYNGKFLDFLVKINSESVLIEVAMISDRIEDDLVDYRYGKNIQGGKVFNELMDKFKNQLQNGKYNSNKPVILVFQLDGRNIDFRDVYDAMYGISGFQIAQDKKNLQIVSVGPRREDNSFFVNNDRYIVSAVVAYKRDYNRGLIGKVFLPPDISKIKNPISDIFRIRLRNAIFGKNIFDNYSSLLQVRGINIDIAKKLYDSGIDDLNYLVLLNDEKIEELSCNIDKSLLKEYRNESFRFSNAIYNQTIENLHGIDQNTYDILASMNIKLISDLKNMKEKPEGVDSEIWDLIREDAYRIFP